MVFYSINWWYKFLYEPAWNSHERWDGSVVRDGAFSSILYIILQGIAYNTNKHPTTRCNPYRLRSCSHFLCFSFSLSLYLSLRSEIPAFNPKPLLHLDCSYRNDRQHLLPLNIYSRRSITRGLAETSHRVRHIMSVVLCITCKFCPPPYVWNLWKTFCHVL